MFFKNEWSKVVKIVNFLICIISHDLKNPAVAQRDALQMLVKNALLWDTATLSKYYDGILKSVEGQVELINRNVLTKINKIFNSFSPLPALGWWYNIW